MKEGGWKKGVTVDVHLHEPWHIKTVSSMPLVLLRQQRVCCLRVQEASWIAQSLLLSLGSPILLRLLSLDGSLPGQREEGMVGGLFQVRLILALPTFRLSMSATEGDLVCVLRTDQNRRFQFTQWVNWVIVLREPSWMSRTQRYLANDRVRCYLI